MNIKRLVLGTAAGALAVTGAQAADLPVVVEPVEYVRICDAFGTGFYYIPGTETCLRVAGRIRADYQFFGDLNDEDDADSVELLSNRGYDDEGDLGFRFRARAYIYMDSRTSTELGLVRTFTELQVQSQNGTSFSAVDVERAFIQFGGLTFGNTRSFYDFADGYYGNFFFFVPEVSDEHTMVAAYTAAFGNGFSASISLEEHSRRHDRDLNDQGVGGFPEGLTRTDWVPDLIGNVRIDQGWGSAQVMGALSWISGSNTGLDPDGDFDDEESELGFAVGAGVNVNLPFGNDTTIGIQGTYGHGMISYVTNEAGFGQSNVDGVFVNNDLELTDAFSVHGGVATSFTPSISTSLGAGYAYVDVDDDDIRSGDYSSLTIDGIVAYEVVQGMEFSIGAQYKYIDSDGGALGPNGIGDLDGSALAGFFRAQRTF